MLKKFNTLIVFIFIFSFFNDNFLVEKFGENSLKVIFILFILTCSYDIYISLKKNFYVLKYFLIFISTLITIVLIHTFMGYLDNSIIITMLKILAIFTIVVYFSNNDLIKNLYFFWISMLSSIIICYFNEPINEWTFRTTGGTADPNEFAAHLLAFIFISIYLFKLNRNYIFIVISIISFLYGFFKAGSMSSFVVLFLLTGLLWIVNFRKFLKLVIPLVLIIFFLVDFSKIQAITNILERTNNLGTADTRFASWEAGINMINDNLIVGIGFNNYISTVQKYTINYLSNHSVAPHNIYLKLLAENGIIIFILFIFLIINIISKNFHLVLFQKELYLLLSLISLLLMGMSLGFIWDNYFWFIVAIYINSLKSIERNF